MAGATSTDHQNDAAVMQKRLEEVDSFRREWTSLLAAAGLPDLAWQTGEKIVAILAGVPLEKSLENEVDTLRSHAPTMFQAMVAALQTQWCARHWCRSLLQAFVEVHDHLAQPDTLRFCTGFVIALYHKTGLHQTSSSMAKSAGVKPIDMNGLLSPAHIWTPPVTKPSPAKHRWKGIYSKMFTTTPTWELMIHGMKEHAGWLLQTLMNALEVTSVLEVSALLQNHNLDDLSRLCGPQHMQPTSGWKTTVTGSTTAPPSNVLVEGACRVLLMCFASVLLQDPAPPLATPPLSWTRYRGLCRLLQCLRAAGSQSNASVSKTQDAAMVDDASEVILIHPSSLRFDLLFEATNPDLVGTMRELTWTLETLLRVPPNSLFHNSRSPFVLLLRFVSEVADKASKPREFQEMGLESYGTLLAKRLLGRFLNPEEEEERAPHTLKSTKGGVKESRRKPSSRGIGDHGPRKHAMSTKRLRLAQMNPHKTMLRRLDTRGHILPERVSAGKSFARARSNSDAEDEEETANKEDNDEASQAMTEEEEQDELEEHEECEECEECELHDDM